MLSEEEIIKTLLNHCYECDLREYSSCNECENKFRKAIQGLLDLYQKEKEKNKELEENYDKLTKHFIENHIPKSKVREKIEEINNSKENYTFERLTSADIRRTIVTNLQELLEESPL